MLPMTKRRTTVSSASGAAIVLAALAFGGGVSASAAATVAVPATAVPATAVPAAVGSATIGAAIASAEGAVVAPAAALAPAIDPAAAQAAAEAAALAEQQARDAAWHTPVASYVISSYYGEARGDGGHYAIDLAGPEGQDVFAARSGTVISAGWQGGYGYAVEIDHGDGHTTLYGHLMGEPYVAVGQHISGGQPIGALGSTGDSSGPHLHLELELNGASVDPSSLIPMVYSTL